MKVVDTIKGVLQDQKDAGVLKDVIYQTPTRANVDLSMVQDPMAVLYVITDRSIDPYRQTAREHAQIAGLFFLVRQPQLGFDGTLNEELVEDMSYIAYDFIDRLRDIGGIQISGEVQMRTVLDMDDTNTTGVCLQFELDEMQGACIALEEQWWLFDNGDMIRFDNDRRVAVR